MSQSNSPEIRNSSLASFQALTAAYNADLQKLRADLRSMMSATKDPKPPQGDRQSSTSRQK